MRTRIFVAVGVLLAACGGDEPAAGASVEDQTTVAIQPQISDSAGIAIWEYPREAWENAPRLPISRAPLLTIGNDEDGNGIDLSSWMFGVQFRTVAAALPEGRTAVLTGEPAQFVVVDSTGRRVGALGRGGEGPGEYRVPTQIITLPGDTLLVYDVARRKAILFDPSGHLLGERRFPTAAGSTAPPPILGAFHDGRTVHRILPFDLRRPEGSDPMDFHWMLPIVALTPGGSQYDTLLVSTGEAMFASNEGPRPVGYGVRPEVAVGPAQLWYAPSKRFEIERRGTAGALQQIIRVAATPRAVTATDRRARIQATQAEWRRLATRRPGGTEEPSFKKRMAEVEKMQFAREVPVLGEIRVDQTGRLWVRVNGPADEETISFAIFGQTGELQYRAALPKGVVIDIGTDRLLLRREDPETGIVRLEVWGFTRGQ